MFAYPSHKKAEKPLFYHVFSPGISEWTSSNIPTNNNYSLFSSTVDDLGHQSAVAQSLPKPITLAIKLKHSSDTLFLFCDNSSALGFLKVGVRHLFLRKEGLLVELDVICILDFFVQTNHQRRGIGLALFKHFLTKFNTSPESLAYDRPSPKLLAFLRKHYNQNHPRHQDNNYVIYPGFFQHNTPKSNKRKEIMSSLDARPLTARVGGMGRRSGGGRLFGSLR
ncbi:hypothetical protein RCL1_007527 [Eukaryota sp. TZLM3-RCL]